ncbi:MAG: CRISPR system precrRNA processing endoribonuclease RAMP protein Cas6 [Peptococcaceae bacterium]|nr:CRISPR system precrRNA processing endoribonuclease RAMP protein Cas6 [Peptococcaceae bacterium]
MNTLAQELTAFRIAKYEVVIRTGEQGLVLPPYKGSTLRGGFGRVFRRVACAQRQGECKECVLKETCPYAYIFETSPPEGSQVLRNLENISRPFVLEPPLETKTEYAPGEELAFGLALFGKAVRYLPYFIICFEELGRVGIGKGRKPYQLARISALDVEDTATEIYNARDRIVKNIDIVIAGEKVWERAQAQYLGRNEISIRLLTVTRLKHDNHFVRSLPFHVLIRGLLRRISSLSYFHHERELRVDYKGLIERAEQVTTVKENTRWVDWARYSHRQDGRVNLGGLMGEVTYRGNNLDEFLPLLALGELIHVGKGAVFGMGRYEIGFTK